MGVDGIGKKGPPVPPAPGGAGERARSGETGRRFEVTPGSGASAARETGRVEAPRTALDRLRAGEIDLDGYVDAKVDEATAHLGKLPAARLDQIRAALRDRISSDPLLADLVRVATGQPAPPLRDE